MALKKYSGHKNKQSVAWSPALGLFAAVAATGTGNRVMTSPDGIVWTAAWSPSLGLFAAVAESGA